MSTSTPPPAWRRKREVKRSAQTEQRRADHAAKIRAQGAAGGPKGTAGGPKGVAQAEWDVLRATVGRLPEGVRDGEWMQLAAVLRSLSSRLAERHSK